MFAKKKSVFNDTPPKIVFILGLLSGIAIISLLTLILFLVNLKRTPEKLVDQETKPVVQQQANNSKQPQQPPPFDAPDQKKPEMKFFVMSFCPFGKQAERGIGPVARLFKNKATIEPHYVIYEKYCAKREECTPEELAKFCLTNKGDYCSMHGIDELREDIRQLCLWKYDQKKWWDYVDAVNAECNLDNIGTCWKGVAEKIGLNINKIEACSKNEAKDLLAVEKELNKKFGVRGSPQVFINGAEYRGGRAPENYKNAVCSGFKKQPKECKEELSLEDAIK